MLLLGTKNNRKKSSVSGLGVLVTSVEGGCSPEQSGVARKKKLWAYFFNIMLVIVPVVIPVLIYSYLMDGMVTLRVSEDFSFSEFQVRAVNYSLGGSFSDPYDSNRVYKDLTLHTGSCDTLFVIEDLRLCFSYMPAKYTDLELMKGFEYFDDTNEEILEYFKYRSIPTRELCISQSLTIQQLRGVEKSIRLPVGSYLMSCHLRVKSVNYTNPYNDCVFETSFVSYYGVGTTEPILHDNLVVSINSACFNASLASSEVAPDCSATIWTSSSVNSTCSIGTSFSSPPTSKRADLASILSSCLIAWLL